MQEFFDIDLVMRSFCFATICISCPVALLFLSFSSLSTLMPLTFSCMIFIIFLMALKRSSKSRMKTLKIRIPWPEVRTISRNIMILKRPVGGRLLDTRSQNGRVTSRIFQYFDVKTDQVFVPAIIEQIMNIPSSECLYT